MKLFKSMGKLRRMNNTSNFEASLLDRIGFGASNTGDAAQKAAVFEE